MNGFPRLVVFLALVVGSSGTMEAVEFSQGNPTDQEQLMLELVNRARSDPQREASRLGIGLNDDLPAGTISPNPKPPLAFHALLIEAARSHSDWMLATDAFSHTGVNGSDPGDRMMKLQFPFSGSWSWGENIAWQGSTGKINTTQTIRAEHDNLIRSHGHRENLMNPDFDEIGIGAREGVFTQGSTYNALMTTQDFALSAGTPGPILLGVVYRDLDGDQSYSPGEGIEGVVVQVEGQKDTARTSSSGGYALPFSGTGMATANFSGNGLGKGYSVPFQRAGNNVKVDLIPGAAVAEPPKIGGITVLSNKRVQISVSGSSGSMATIESSLDLKSWLTSITLTIDVGQTSVKWIDPNSNSMDGSRSFYRLGN